MRELKHEYGANVHLLESAYHELLLARFSTPEMTQPELSHTTRKLSQFLLSEALHHSVRRTPQQFQTRMSTLHPKEALIKGNFIDSNTQVVVVDLMRAGILPAQTVFETLHDVLPACNLRQDHLLLNRAVNKSEEVIGVDLSGHKIGGSIQDAMVIVPDPMAATGSTIQAVFDLYTKLGLGRPRKWVALHFIVTPEYLSRMKPYAKDLEIFALRLDRGLSSQDVLATSLGQRWSEERGLNEKQYIVPGAGGIGEILNNCGQ